MDATTLLEHREFVLQVARALLRDEADAQDAVQDTYVAAMQSAPPREGRVRPWLGGIVRNIARNRHRSEGRRLSREARAARPDRAPGAEESSERLRWQQRVVEAVLALDPKYRDVLVLRFYEDLPPREVAQRLDIPVNTVRTRTRRAIEQLRGTFDRNYGGRKAWSAAIAGLVLAQTAASAGVPKLLVAAALVVVTATTAALIHSTTRTEDVAPARLATHDPSSGSANTDSTGGAKDPTKTANPRKAAKPHTKFRGRLFQHGTDPLQPLVGATVMLGRTHAFDGSSTFRSLNRTAVTDAEGRFELDWKTGWKFVGYSRSPYLLVVRHESRWSDAIYASDDGLKEGEGFRSQVELVDNPRFQFVAGPSRAPIASAQLSLFPALRNGGTELGEPFARAVTDPTGTVRVEWPSTIERGILRLKRPGGDVLQWQFTLAHARQYDPYDITFDADTIATVRMAVQDRDGKPAGAGVRVVAHGSWAPDGLTEGPYVRVAHGAEPVPLIGTTDSNGIATFRFPADRAREGIYLPQRMIAIRVRNGKLEFVSWTRAPKGRPEDEGARTGSTLPVLRFGVTRPAQPMFAVVGDVPPDEMAIYWRDEQGGIIEFGVDQETLYRVPGYTIFQLFDGILDRVRGKGEVAFVIQVGEDYRWVKLAPEEFVRCLQGESIVEPGPAQKPIELTIHPPTELEWAEIWFESVAIPFQVGYGSEGGEPNVIELPPFPGKWKARMDGQTLREVLLDPRAGVEYKLELK